MATFVLAKKDVEHLETTVFSSEAGDTVAVFTDPNNAEKYLKEAGWEGEMTVAELNPIELIEWLLHCFRHGVQLMATDPDRKEQEEGLAISTLNIEGQLNHAGLHIFEVANREF